MPNEQTKSELSRAKILDAAARIFRDKGYAATTLNEIAETADMKAGSLYYHFDCKEEILEEVLDMGMRRIHEAVEDSQIALPPGTSHYQRIHAAVEAHLTTLLRHGDYTSANIRIFDQIPDDVRHRHLRLRNAYAACWRRILNTAQKDGALRNDVDLPLIRMLLMGALNWSVEWYKPGKKSIRSMADHICMMLFEGIATKNDAQVIKDELMTATNQEG